MNISKFLNGAFHYPMSPEEGAGGGGAAASGEQGAGATATGVGGAGGEGGAGAGGEGGGGAGGEQGASASGEGAAKPVPFPDNWRETFATGADGKIDEKKLNILKRYTSPLDYSNSAFALRQKIDTGEFKQPLAKDAKPEEVAAWRKANGIPADPKEYLNGLPEAVSTKFGDAEKAALDPFLQQMHDMNVPPAAVQAALANYVAADAVRAEAVQAHDAEVQAQTEDTLRAEWGGDYRANLTAVHALIDSQFPKEFKDLLFSSRLGDEKQTPLMHHPQFLRSLASMGRIMNPQSTVTHGAGTDTVAAMDDQIKAYQKRMGSAEWFKDDKAQAHYRELITAKERMGGK